MMRLAKGRAGEQTPVAQQPCDGVDHGEFQRLARGKLGQQTGQARGEHGLAGTGRVDEQEVVPTGDRDLERALRRFLPLHIGQAWEA